MVCAGAARTELPMGGVVDHAPEAAGVRAPASEIGLPWWRARALALPAVFLLSLSVLAQTGLPDNPEDGSVAAEPSLEVVNCDLLDTRDGFAIPPDTRFLPGERVHLVCQIKGYGIDRDERLDLSYEVAATDAGAQSFYPRHEGRYDAELAPQDKNWLPIIRYSPLIPVHANGGTFILRVSVTDHIAEASASAEVPFEVDAPVFDLADGLAIRAFHVRHHPSDLPPWESYARAQRGVPVERLHRPGDEFSVAFLITGYEVRDDNGFDVLSQAWLIAADGRELVDLGVTRESGRPSYPRLWIPGDLRIQLDPAIATGEYAIRVRLYDRFGRAERVYEYPLRVGRDD